MAISKVKTNSITDANVTTAKITDANVTTAKIADNNVTNAKLATGISASKLTGALPAISGANLTGVSQFTAPTISSFTPTQVANAATAASITISGANFQDTPRVLFQNANTGAVITADTVTFTNSTTLVVTKAAGTLPEGLYNLQVINKDGISVISGTSYTNSATPTWVTSAGSLGTFVKGSSVTGDTFVVFAGDADSSTITYSETTSVLATANMVLEAFTGGGYNKVRIKSSSASPDSVTTYTFTLRATDPAGKTADRQFSIGSIANTNPAFTTASGSLGTIVDSSRGSYSLATAAATDAEGDTLTYAISAGSIPGGLSFNTSTAAITGTASAVGSNTTSTFSITCTDGVGGSATRQFTITVLAPTTQQYTSGSGTWPAPFTGNITMLLVAAGGGQSSTQGHAGGGGGGGVVSMAYPVTSGTTYNYAVGPAQGGSPWDGGDTTFGTGSGTDATFLTAIGGGNGGTGNGGSGGGKSHSPGSGGNGIQTTSPLVSANSRSNGFGNNGGSKSGNAYPHPSGGGGGANAAGGNASGSTSGGGGAGKDFTATFGTTVGDSGVFAGGGGGGGHNPVGTGGATRGAGGSGGGGQGGGPGSSAGQAGQANTGGGGGSGAAAGSGFIIFKY